MKKYIPIIISSLLSAMFAVLIYKQFESPKIIVREVAPAKYTNYTEGKQDVLSNIHARQFISSSPTDFIAAAEAVTPAVVNIKALQSGSNSDLWWGGNTLGTSTGSGVIISSDGYIVTNNHVIEGSTDLEVTLNDRRDYEAKLIGVDMSTDLALIKIEAKNLPYLRFGNSDSLRIGEWVLAVGNPFNLESTVTAGIVSAKGRNINILEDRYSIESFIQTDAVVNPGNSGGALVNTNGELIGINTAIITKSGRFEGYSFAVPANLARKVIRDLRDFGEVQRGIMGVGIEQVNSLRASELKLAKVEGIEITRVTPGSGADEAGLKREDVIVSINSIKTGTMPELQEQIGQFRPGDKLHVEYIRRGKLFKTRVELKNIANTTEIITKEDKKDADLLATLGFELKELTKSEQRRLKVAGVRVVSIYRDSRIERTNMDPDFIITKIDDETVSSVEEVLNYLKQASGKVMLEGIYENYPGEYYYAFPVD